MIMSLFLSILSVAVAAISAISAIFSARASTRSSIAAQEALSLNREVFAQNKVSAERSAELTKKMFLRQGVIDLYMAWQGVADIDPNNTVVPEVIKAANALSLTASLWNHDIVDKIILYQNYWVMFDTLFRRLDSWDKTIPHIRIPGKNLLTREIRRAYKEMSEVDLSKADQSHL